MLGSYLFLFPISIKLIIFNIATLVILGYALLNGLKVHTGSQVRNPQEKGQGHHVEPILVETSIFHSCASIYWSPPKWHTVENTEKVYATLTSPAKSQSHWVTKVCNVKQQGNNMWNIQSNFKAHPHLVVHEVGRGLNWKHSNSWRQNYKFILECVLGLLGLGYFVLYIFVLQRMYVKRGNKHNKSSPENSEKTYREE